MTARDDGGPAYPQPISHSLGGGADFPCNWALGGMTLRDYFAGQALVAMGQWVPGMAGTVHEVRAIYAYEQADAMIAERSKP